MKEILHMIGLSDVGRKKVKHFSLGMKQRIGIAMALLGNPKLLVLDEPINGLDADGMRIMREVLTDIAKTGATVLISSHILGELEKVATHYGIIRDGKMIVEMTAAELESSCPTFIAIQTKDLSSAKDILEKKFKKVLYDEEKTCLRIYDAEKAEDVVQYLYEHGIIVNELKTDKIGLEEYYINLMTRKEVKSNGN